MSVPIHIEFYEHLDPGSYFADPGHEAATAEECAESARAYIEKRGMSSFIDDWNVGSFNVYVAGIEVAFDGRAAQAQNTDTEPAK